MTLPTLRPVDNVTWAAAVLLVVAPFQAIKSSADRVVSISNQAPQGRLSDLRIVLFGIGARADRPDHFALDDDRKRAPHLDEARCRHCGNSTIVDRVVEILTRLFEQGRCSRCTRRKLNPSEQGGMFHPLD
jgi:hypothetical protein